MNGIVECGINFLSLERAKGLVPPEFIEAYEWFTDNEGEHIPRLPKGNDAPQLSTQIKLAAMRGIHSPNYKELPSKGAGKSKYALSIYSAAGKSRVCLPGQSYQDKDVVSRGDGTWTLEYSEQKTALGKRDTDRSNDYLMNNLVDGVPVAVMVGQPKGGYVIYGLAYVERYSPETGMFTLHGPVSAEHSGVRFYSETAYEQLSEEEIEILRKSDEMDQKARVLMETVRREKQGQFRYALLRAYESRCAVTGVDVKEVLQAAHIDPYRGKRSQTVNNGILLRADLHLLYDSHLMTILPDSFEVKISNSIATSAYSQLNGIKMRIPGDRSLWPDEYRLDFHAREFESVQRMLA